MSRAMKLKAIIRNLALEKRLPAQVILQNFMLERLLERIAISPYRSKFKNFMLTEHHIRLVIDKILAVKLDDGVILRFIRIEEIRETDTYTGYRLSLEGIYDTLKIPIKIDLTTGDRITPDAIQYEYQLLLEQRTISIFTYNIETILAEKMETIITRGILNTRLRDFYDVYILSKLETIKVDHTLYSKAVAATLDRRGTSEVVSKVESVVKMIREDQIMQERWLKYQREFEYAREITFNETLDVVENLALFT